MAGDGGRCTWSWVEASGLVDAAVPAAGELCGDQVERSQGLEREAAQRHGAGMHGFEAGEGRPSRSRF